MSQPSLGPSPAAHDIIERQCDNQQQTNAAKDRNKKNPIEALPLSMITSGSAPAGGCTQRASCIKAIASPTDSAICHTPGPANQYTANPTAVESRCPNTRLRGCANALSGAPNSRTLDAPNGAITKGLLVRCPSREITPIARKPPRKPNAACLNGAKGTAGAARAICSFIVFKAYGNAHADPQQPDQRAHGVKPS